MENADGIYSVCYMKRIRQKLRFDGSIIDERCSFRYIAIDKELYIALCMWSACSTILASGRVFFQSAECPQYCILTRPDCGRAFKQVYRELQAASSGLWLEVLREDSLDPSSPLPPFLVALKTGFAGTFSFFFVGPHSGFIVLFRHRLF